MKKVKVFVGGEIECYKLCDNIEFDNLVGMFDDIKFHEKIGKYGWMLEIEKYKCMEALEYFNVVDPNDVVDLRLISASTLGIEIDDVFTDYTESDFEFEEAKTHKEPDILDSVNVPCVIHKYYENDENDLCFEIELEDDEEFDIKALKFDDYYSFYKDSRICVNYILYKGKKYYGIDKFGVPSNNQRDNIPNCDEVFMALEKHCDDWHFISYDGIYNAHSDYIRIKYNDFDDED